MKRRFFFGWLGVGWLASLLPMAISACSRQKVESSALAGIDPASNLPTRADGFMLVGTVAELDRTGSLQTKIAGKSAIVRRDPTRKNNFQALNLTCTHAGCTVDWNPDSKAFECPCHDSRFASDGKVLQGPAQRALQAYLAKLEGNKILVKVN